MNILVINIIAHNTFLSFWVSFYWFNHSFKQILNIIIRITLDLLLIYNMCMFRSEEDKYFDDNIYEEDLIKRLEMLNIKVSNEGSIENNEHDSISRILDSNGDNEDMLKIDEIIRSISKIYIFRL